MAGGTSHLLLLYALTDLTACLTPGPAVLAVMSHALGGSRRGAAGAILGINLGNLVWFTMAGLGLVAVLKAWPLLFAILRWGGIGYLVWLSIQTWRNHDANRYQADREPVGFRKGMVSAIAVQLSNPKALLFFTVMLPPFIDVRAPVAPQIAILALIAVTIEAGVLAGYALLAHRVGKASEQNASATHWLNRASAALLMLAAGLLARTGLSA